MQSALLLLHSEGNNVPDELPGQPVAIDLTSGPDNVALTRGQYRIRFTVKLDAIFAEQAFESGAILIDNKTVRINARDPLTGDQLVDELKRIHVYKLDMMPPDSEGVSTCTAVIRVLDNPLIVSGIVTALALAAGAAGFAWLNVDDIGGVAEEFSLFGNSLMVAAAFVSLYLFVSNGK